MYIFFLQQSFSITIRLYTISILLHLIFLKVGSRKHWTHPHIAFNFTKTESVTLFFFLTRLHCKLSITVPQARGGFTWADLDEAIVLYEDGITGQVPMDDCGLTWMQITEETLKEKTENKLTRRAHVWYLLSAPWEINEFFITRHEYEIILLNTTY